MITKRITCTKQLFNANKQIHLVGKHIILTIHQNATIYSYIGDVSVSGSDLHG